ncbi:glycosyltransferase family 4 protein [Paenirhodobacter populi]|uniref:Glycosyltransferase family 1 protein n=1 Tax=Paenirhodobacter populi TaxID=2306993 RepID=A0A443J037_9RHOB|nr:glycosyltransferase family 4 protein [Sinirhodobacter populi]RWR13732.1 glycosyltransferase family 1 protein [Sinirhodobacter populi]
MSQNLPDPIEVIAPNLKRRLSGVTATIVRLVPVQARMIGIVTTGPGLPADLPHVPVWRLRFLPRRLRVWHARRNTEMLLGLALRASGMPLKLLFTSASQRRHTGYTKWLISRMDAVVSTSAKTASYLDRPSTVIHHGIDTQTFTPPGDRAELRARLGLPGGLLVGCYGRIRAQKGTDAFVDAMIRLLRTRPGVTALVMGRATEGQGAFLDGLKAKVKAEGLEDRILFPPEVPVDRMADWYRVLDLYVAPQRWEGFGLTPIEAMACGVPVVATRVGAFEEIVTPRAGALVDPGDVPALAAACAPFLDNPARLEEASVAARAHVETHFRIEDEAAALVRIYRGLLG